MGNSWEHLAYGDVNNPTCPDISWKRRLKALMEYLSVVRLYQRQGYPSVHLHISQLKENYKPIGEYPTTLMERLARRELPYWRACARVFNEDYLCLPASLSITSALIALGLPAQCVIAKPKGFLLENFAFHAWSEIDGIPINEDAIRRQGFFVVMRHPIWDQCGHCRRTDDQIWLCLICCDGEYVHSAIQDTTDRSATICLDYAFFPSRSPKITVPTKSDSQPSTFEYSVQTAGPKNGLSSPISLKPTANVGRDPISFWDQSVT